MIAITTASATAFKYVTPQVAASMMERGSARIGTLHEYRRLESSDVRGDREEGYKIATSAPGPTTYLDGSHIHQWLRSKGVRVQGSIFTSGSNAVVHQQQHPDCFIFCASERFSLQLMAKFGGACIQITNVQLFFQALDRAFMDYLPSVGGSIREAALGRCLYMERRQPYLNQPQQHPCLVKPPRFAEEAEIRAVWLPSTGVVAPVILEVPSLVQYLRVVTGNEKL
jgi:hypothetical protein